MSERGLAFGAPQVPQAPQEKRSLLPCYRTTFETLQLVVQMCLICGLKSEGPRSYMTTAGRQAEASELC